MCLTKLRKIGFMINYWVNKGNAAGILYVSEALSLKLHIEGCPVGANGPRHIGPDGTVVAS